MIQGWLQNAEELFLGSDPDCEDRLGGEQRRPHRDGLSTLDQCLRYQWWLDEADEVVVKTRAALKSFDDRGELDSF